VPVYERAGASRLSDKPQRVTILYGLYPMRPEYAKRISYRLDDSEECEKHKSKFLRSFFVICSESGKRIDSIIVDGTKPLAMTSLLEAPMHKNCCLGADNLVAESVYGRFSGPIVFRTDLRSIPWHISPMPTYEAGIRATLTPEAAKEALEA
jgi:hypothetical protein